MCGIAGAYNSNGGADLPGLRRMCDQIVHRGPDDSGELLDGPVGLGHRRLSIIDLEAGRQPIFNEDGSLAIVFNGEIYNFKELRSGLESRGHRFRTHSDTEVILHLFEEDGEDCVEKLRGMFAFAIWDRNRESLFLARDRLGIKPLYYSFQDGLFLFASEAKAILAYGKIRGALDRRALEQYLTFRYVPAPLTMFEGVFKLPAGHTLCMSRTGLRTKPYWNLSYQEISGVEEDLREELMFRVEEAVRLRLIADVPLGALLSGGVDSSVIVAMMSKLSSGAVKTFSVGFESETGEFNELAYARRVANAFGTQHHEISVGFKDFEANLPKLIWHLDEPVSEPAAIPTLLVSQLAAQHVKVVLTGEGSDEIFAGYPKYAYDRLSSAISWMPRHVLSGLQRVGSRLMPERAAKIARFGEVLAIGPEERRLPEWFGVFSPERKATLLKETRFPGCELEVVRAHLAEGQRLGPLNRMLYLDTKTWLVDDLLMKGDKMTMAASVEGRVPFLDHPLVEWAACLPLHMKVRGRTTKYLLKRAAGKFLPEQLVYRKKVGFAVPLAKWFRGEMRPFLIEMLLDNRTSSIFNPDAVKDLVQDHVEGRVDNHRELWALLNFELWSRQFLSEASEVV